MIEPGSTIGILGGGQLGRMLALAAASMGYRVHILAPEAELPAGDVAAAVTRADYIDFAALDAFAAAIDVATFEFENIDTRAVAYLAGRVPVHPSAASLEVAQDRLAENASSRRWAGVRRPTVPSTASVTSKRRWRRSAPRPSSRRGGLAMTARGRCG